MCLPAGLRWSVCKSRMTFPLRITLKHINDNALSGSCPTSFNVGVVAISRDQPGSLVDLIAQADTLMYMRGSRKSERRAPSTNHGCLSEYSTPGVKRTTVEINCSLATRVEDSPESYSVKTVPSNALTLHAL